MKQDPCPLRGTPHCQETAARYEIDPTQEPCVLQNEWVCQRAIMDEAMNQLWTELAKPLVPFVDAFAAAVTDAWSVIRLVLVDLGIIGAPESWHARRGLKVRGRRRSGRLP